MRTLLLVDSDRLLRWSLETHLRQWFRIVSAENRQEALALLEAGPLDALIHGLEQGDSSADLEQAARKYNQQIRIIRMTTGDPPTNSDPTVAILEKPFRLKALAGILGVSASGAEAGPIV